MSKSSIWAMIQVNDFDTCVTAHATEEDAYKDILDTVLADLVWIGLFGCDAEGAKELESCEDLERYHDLCRDANDPNVSAKEVYEKHLKGRFDPDDGFNMTVCRCLVPQDNGADPWHDNLVQFSRLIAELSAFGLTEEQQAHLVESMDLPEAKIEEIVERAQVEFHRTKYFDGPKRETPHQDVVAWRNNAFGQ